jgi:hypothetical protein
MNVVSRSLSQIGFHFARAMGRRSVPDHQLLVIRPRPQTLQEVNAVRRLHRIISHHGEQLAPWRHRAQPRDHVAGLMTRSTGVQPIGA